MSPQAALERKAQLEQSGLIQGYDFTWTYIPPDERSINRTVIFHFRDPALATFYKLKWS
jgi:hypothetical protein